ncbi:isochorismatase family protein [Enterococcus devriesei]|uniref:isochorismatase family protein n=1 Tax=Enterococcus devriesei TaxID=319970 RepID=UPI001C11FAAC|nr:isochorismatase family protein [Enterococcus devriesei]MBU5366583.1 isochorismatase family protein [Enterococcus devriesei]
MKKIDLARTALVVIDLQKGIMGTGELQPYSASVVLEKNNQLAAALKNTAGLVTLVNVDPTTMQFLNPERSGGYANLPAAFSEFIMSIATDSNAKNVIKVTKHNPGAFFGTDLDLQLRRRDIDTIILTGVATANGVYATALDAYQHGYKVIVVEDGCADRDIELHQIFFEKLFTKLGQVATTKEVLEMI